MRHQKQQLAQRMTVERLVAAYMEEEAEIREGFAKIADAEKRLNDVFTMDGYCSIAINRHRVDFTNPNDALNEVRRSQRSTTRDMGFSDRAPRHPSHVLQHSLE